MLLRHRPPEPRPPLSPRIDSIPPVVAERADSDATLPWSLRWLGPARQLLRARSFYRARIAFLLTVLLSVVLWGAHDWSDRRARTTWQRPLRVALVLVEREPVPKDLLDLLTARSFELERRLATEYARHTGRSGTPIEVVVRGAGRWSEPPPVVEEEGFGHLLSHALRQWHWTRTLDAQVQLEASFDSRIYLVLKPALDQPLAFVEGHSELGGRVGIAQADLDRGTIDFALFVVAHELLHTLGATDKYDEKGRTSYPRGFVDPGRVPLYPQPGAEVMARHVPVAPATERPPETLDELYVGDVTARELGWR